MRQELRDAAALLDDALRTGELVTSSMIAGELGIAKQNFSSATTSGALEHVRVGRNVFFTRAALAEWRNGLAFQRIKWEGDDDE